MKTLRVPDCNSEVERALEWVLRDGDFSGVRVDADGRIRTHPDGRELRDAVELHNATLKELQSDRELTGPATIRLSRVRLGGDFDFEIGCLTTGRSLGLYGAFGKPVVGSETAGGRTYFQIAFYPRIVTHDRVITSSVKEQALRAFEIRVSEPSEVVVLEV